MSASPFVRGWHHDGYDAKSRGHLSDDRADPTACNTPMDIEVDRDKVRTLFNLSSEPSELVGDQFSEDVYWMITECWADVGCRPPLSIQSTNR